jgi:hypothetical protein
MCASLQRRPFGEDRLSTGDMSNSLTRGMLFAFVLVTPFWLAVAALMMMLRR